MSVGISWFCFLQHFYMDVYFGMALGIISPTLAYLIIKRSAMGLHSKKLELEWNKPVVQSENLLQQSF
jgi:hypothetical protein